MAIDKIDKNLDIVDSILTKITKILKKHWLVIVFLLVSLFVYWSLTTEFYDDDYYYYDDDEYYEEYFFEEDFLN